MLPRHDEPIVAVATAAGRGAVGIVRASGRDLAPLIVSAARAPPRAASRDLSALPRRGGRDRPWPRDLVSGAALLHRREVLELQAHGGPGCCNCCLARCLEAGAHIGLRPARPGEFTERAFLHERIDLAPGRGRRRPDRRQHRGRGALCRARSDGAFSREVGLLRDRFVELRTLVEATPRLPLRRRSTSSSRRGRGAPAGAAAALAAVLGRRARARCRARASPSSSRRPAQRGQELACSTVLAGAELAIVTAIPGTTRDKVSQTIQIGRRAAARRRHRRPASPAGRRGRAHRHRACLPRSRPPTRCSSSTT